MHITETSCASAGQGSDFGCSGLCCTEASSGHRDRLSQCNWGTRQGLSCNAAEQAITARALDQYYHLEEDCLVKKADVSKLLLRIQVRTHPCVQLVCRNLRRSKQ